MSFAVKDQDVYSELPAVVKRKAKELGLVNESEIPGDYVSYFLRNHANPKTVSGAGADMQHQVNSSGTHVPFHSFIRCSLLEKG